MGTHYVSDYEQVTGLKPDGSPLKTEVIAKVVTAPAKAEPKKAVAQTKAPRAK